MLLLNIDHIPGQQIEAVGLVKGNVVKPTKKNFKAEIKSLAGGEIDSLTQMLSEARQMAVGRMVEEAKELGGRGG